MGSGWIDTVYNNSDKVVKIRSRDNEHNGTMVNENNPLENFDLADGQFHELKPHTKYWTDWLAIPWYYRGKRYKSYSADNTINFFNSQIGSHDYVMFVNDANGKMLMRQRVPTDCDFYCTMRFENDGVWIDIVNHDSTLDVEFVREMCESGNWVKNDPLDAANVVSAFDDRNSLEEQ